MAIHFSCSRCGKAQVVEASRAGTTLACPACQASLTVPASSAATLETRPSSPPGWWAVQPPAATPASTGADEQPPAAKRTADWWVAQEPRPSSKPGSTYVAPPLERKPEGVRADAPAPAPVGLPLDVPELQNPAPLRIGSSLTKGDRAEARARPETNTRQGGLLVAIGALVALVLLAGALAILALPGSSRNRTPAPQTVAGLTPGQLEELPDPGAPHIQTPKKIEKGQPTLPPRKIEILNPGQTTVQGPPQPRETTTVQGPPQPRETTTVQGPPRPADPPSPVIAPAPPVPPLDVARLLTAPGKLVVKRRRALTEDDLRRQIEKAREVALDRTPARRESEQVVYLSKLAHARNQHGEVMARVLRERVDLAGLPFRMGEECHLGPAAADNLQGGSLALRDQLGKAAGITAGSALAVAGDTRPDPRVLYNSLMAAGERHNKWLKPEAIPALQQLLMAENESIRAVLVDQLAHIEGPRASVALAQRALYDLNFDVRKSALEALARRPAAEYRDELLKGFNYPWDAVADHAAEALAALKMREVVPTLIGLLDRPGPEAPHTLPRKPGQYVKELVRVNHLRNCLMCHATSLALTDKVRGFVPPSNQELPPAFTRQYYQSTRGIFARADVTYLRQDFSVPLNVKNPGKWPAAQRFDFMVRERPATLADIAARQKPAPRPPSERLKALFFVLRELTGADPGPSAEDWKRLFLHQGKITRRHQGMVAAGGVAVDGKGRLFVADAGASTILRAGDDGKLVTFLKDSAGSQSLAFDPRGRLLACQAGTGRIVAMDPVKKTVEVVADQYNGRRFQGPAYLTVDRRGGIYFTDTGLTGLPPDRGGAVYYVSALGVATRLPIDLARPRGIGLSPDGKTLYVVGTGKLAVMAYPLEGAGLPGKGRVLGNLEAGTGVLAQGGEGLTVDRQGNVYVANPARSSIQVFNPEGARLGRFAFPEPPVGCTLGGEGGRVLHVTTRAALYQMPVEAGSDVAVRE